MDRSARALRRARKGGGDRAALNSADGVRVEQEAGRIERRGQTRRLVHVEPARLRVPAAREQPAPGRAALRKAIDPRDRVGPVAAFLGQAEEAGEVVDARAFRCRTSPSGSRSSCSSTHRITPVRPSPPTVAANSSAFSSRESVSTSPEERARPIALTCAPKVPACSWFLPCTSFATAPPRVTNFVPGTTGGNQPCGTVTRSRRSSVSPASARSTPRSRSKL